jgi:hypothetical protein
MEGRKEEIEIFYTEFVLRLSTMNFLLLSALDLLFCNIFNQTGTSVKRKHSLDMKMYRFLGIPL